MSYGYAGKILWIDLNTGKSYDEPTEKYTDWIGGRSLGSYLLSQQLDLLESEPSNQPIIIATGPLVAIGIPLGTRTAVSARNQVSGGFCYSNVGGDFGTCLKMAGYDALVIHGASSRPVYVLLHNDKCLIHPADEIWGMTITPMQEYLHKKYGKTNLSFIGIGLAGEHGSNISCLMVDQAHAAGWGGSGMLFGIKKLKAIVAQGSKAVSAFDIVGLKSKARQLEWRLGASEAIAAIRRGGTHGIAGAGGFSRMVPTAVRNLQDEFLPDEELSPIREEAFHRWKKKHTGCVGCSISCLHYYTLENKRYGTLNVEGMHANSVRGLGTNLGVNDPIDLIKLHHTVNEYGLDVDGVSAAIAFALECADHGILDRHQPGDITLEWGNGPCIVALIEQIACQNGLGKLLSEGVYDAAHKIGRGSEQYAMTTKRVGINEQGLRSNRSWALGIMTSTRGGGHLGGATQAENKRYSLEVGTSLFGNPNAGDPYSYKGKGKMVAWTEGLKAIIDSLGLCYLAYGWNEPSLGNMDELADILYLATGVRMTGDGLHRQGIRTHTLERYLSYRLGGFTRKDDRLPDRIYDTAVSSGLYEGAHLDREKVNQALEEYYDSLGWNPDTGLPSVDLMKQMGIAYLIKKKDV